MSCFSWFMEAEKGEEKCVVIFGDLADFIFISRNWRIEISKDRSGGQNKVLGGGSWSFNPRYVRAALHALYDEVMAA